MDKEPKQAFGAFERQMGVDEFPHVMGEHMEEPLASQGLNIEHFEHAGPQRRWKRLRVSYDHPLRET